MPLPILVRSGIVLSSRRYFVLNTKFLGLLAIAVLVAGIPAYAHHSFAAEFDGSRSVRLTGTITRIEWSNPHSYFFLDVKDDKGIVVNWGSEGAGPGARTRRGGKKGEVKLGDTRLFAGYQP